MDFARLEYIKNVNADSGWAYADNPRGADFRLNFKRGDGVSDARGVEAHALNLPKGSLIILSQKPLEKDKRYLTHIVELVNEGYEDKPHHEKGTWGIFRLVKIHWIADFDHTDKIPLDKNEMKANWGWFDTKAKSLKGDSLMREWKTIENLRTHLEFVFTKKYL